MSAARPSHWMLLPSGAALALFAAAHGDVAWTPACFVVMLVSFLHERTTRWPARTAWPRVALAAGGVIVAAIAWHALALSPSETLRPVPRMLPASDALVAVTGLVIAAALAWTWHVEERRSTKEAVVLGGSGVLVVLAGNFYGHGLGHGAGQAAWAGLALLACAMAAASDDGRRPLLAARLRRLAAAAGLGALILAWAVVIGVGLRAGEALIAGGLPAFSLPSLGPGLGSGSAMTLERDGDLELSDEPVATMDGASPPGYLRTQVFTAYENGRWTESRLRPEPLPAATGDAGWRAGTLSTRLDVAPPHGSPVPEARRIMLLASLQGRVPLPYGDWRLATPDAVAWLRAPGDLAGSLPAGALVDVAIAPAEATRPASADAEADASLSIPDDVRATLRPVALAIAGEAAGDAQEAARRIARHLETEHDYALSARLAREGDPVVDFVLNRRAGWCEHFAAAMVLLLRSIDVPARVAGGYHADEWNASGGCWIVRRSDAHAWCEVYDAGRGLWVAHDPTPPSATAAHAATGWREAWRDLRESLVLRARRLAIAVRRVDVAGAIASVRDAVAERRGLVVAIVVLAAVALAAPRLAGSSPRAAMAWLVDRVRRRERAAEPPSEAATRCMLGLIARVEARAGRMRPSETVEEYLDRVAAAAPPALERETLQALREVTRAHGALRFGAPRDDAGAALAALRERARAIEASPDLVARGRRAG